MMIKQFSSPHDWQVPLHK